LVQFAATRQISIAWARLFFLYGPYEDSARLVPSVALRLIHGEEAHSTGGKQIRDYLHVEDVARALVATAFSKVEGAINIGSGIPVTIRSIVEMIGVKTERSELLKLGSLPYRQGEPPLIVASNSLLLSETDWRPQFDIETGIEATVEWWKQAAN
jgi:nucleoside-diphosphate-sugar epimerase